MSSGPRGTSGRSGGLGDDPTLPEIQRDPTAPVILADPVELAETGRRPEADEATPLAVRIDAWRRHYLPLPDEVVHEYLGEDEYVVHTDHPSFRAFLIKNGFQVLVLGFATIIFLVFLGGGIDLWTILIFFIVQLILIFLALKRLSDRYTNYVITNLRLIRLSGIFGRKLASIPWTRMTGLGYRQRPMGRILGYASIFIESANEESGLREFSDINDPAAFHQKILDMVSAKSGQSTKEPPPATRGVRKGYLQRRRERRALSIERARRAHGMIDEPATAQPTSTAEGNDEAAAGDDDTGGEVAPARDTGGVYEALSTSDTDSGHREPSPAGVGTATDPGRVSGDPARPSGRPRGRGGPTRPSQPGGAGLGAAAAARSGAGSEAPPRVTGRAREGETGAGSAAAHRADPAGARAAGASPAEAGAAADAEQAARPRLWPGGGGRRAGRPADEAPAARSDVAPPAPSTPPHGTPITVRPPSVDSPRATPPPRAAPRPRVEAQPASPSPDPEDREEAVEDVHEGEEPLRPLDGLDPAAGPAPGPRPVTPPPRGHRFGPRWAPWRGEDDQTPAEDAEDEAPSLWRWAGLRRTGSPTTDEGESARDALASLRQSQRPVRPVRRPRLPSFGRRPRPSFPESRQLPAASEESDQDQD